MLTICQDPSHFDLAISVPSYGPTASRAPDVFTAIRYSMKDNVAMPAPTLDALHAQHPADQDLWVFGYASLIWRQEFVASEQHLTRVLGWHRALKMWSHINRGTPECPGLVFALLPGGSCQGVVFRIPAEQAHQALVQLWQREMPRAVYTPRWLPCATPGGVVRALSFTLPRTSPSFTGTLTAAQYQSIFAQSRGRYGTTLDYARQTYASLQALGIEDRALRALLAHAPMSNPGDLQA